MNIATKRALLTLLLTPFLLLATAESGYGIWQSLLNDHFDNNQQVLVQRWPWNTPFQNPNIGWHYNPYDPYYNAEGAHRSNYSWGWQNFIFNVNVVDRAEFPGAIWCAYTNLNDINNPRWPEDDDYMNGQIAWAWWGPMDLRHAISGSVSWWMKVDLANYNYDSLSVVIFTPENRATVRGDLAYNQPNFRINQPFGAMRDGNGEFDGLSIFTSTSDGWVQRSFELDDLRILNEEGEIVDSVSYLGLRDVWLGFVWNTNGGGVAGKGAFIDDVIVGMDDGRFDLSADKALFGHRNEENIDWNEQAPYYHEQVALNFDWYAEGLGDTPEFTVRCALDGEVIFEEVRQVAAGTGELYHSETPFWEASAGRHTLRWTLDPTEVVDETLENNNVLDVTFEVPWLPAPTITIDPLPEDSVPCDIDFDIVVTLADSNETDTSLTSYLFWTKDTAGFTANPLIIYGWNYIIHRFDLPQGEWRVPTNFIDEYENGDISVGDEIFIAGFVADQIPANVNFALAPGRILAGSLGVENDLPYSPITATLVSAHPNPFNGELRIDYQIARTGSVELKVFDLGGREVKTLLSGSITSPGRYTTSWKPGILCGGVYILRLATADGVKLQKVVYTP